MAVEFKLELEGDDDNRIERGDYVEAGWYYLRLVDVADDPKVPGAVAFKYVVLNGLYRGYTILDRVMDPAHADDETKARYARQRQKLYAKRLGLIQESDYGHVVSKSWYDAIGREVLGHATERKFTKKDGGEGKAVQLDFAGVYPLDFPPDKLPKDFPALLRPLLTGSPSYQAGTSAAAASGGTGGDKSAPANPPDDQVDFSDL